MASHPIETFETPHAVAEEAARAIAEGLGEAIRERGSATFIAAGGRSPGPIYDLLARAELDWGKVAVTLTDERWVDPHGPDANARFVRERLCVERAADARFVSLKTDHATPPEAAAEVEGRLRAVLPADVALIGMGEDGHVASLFPGGPVDAQGLAVGVETGVPQPRISLTLEALQPRALAVLAISGAAKREVLEHGEGLPVHVLLGRLKTPVRVLWSP